MHGTLCRQPVPSQLSSDTARASLPLHTLAPQRVLARAPSNAHDCSPGCVIVMPTHSRATAERSSPWPDLFRSVEAKANGRLLLHGIEAAHEQTGGRLTGRPRGWLAAAAVGGGGGGGGADAASGGNPPAGSAGSAGGARPGAGGSTGPHSSLSALVAAIQDAGRLLGDPAFRDVPVPAVYLGGLPAPIPAGARDMAGLH